MSALGKVEMSPKIVPGATGDDDVEDCNEHHDEHARAELRADGSSLEYARFDKLPFIDAGAIVENTRLGHALKVAQLIQAQRHDRRCGGMPSRTNSGARPRLRRAEIGKKRPSIHAGRHDAAVRKQAA
jgi:hypothetical protein